MIEIIELHLSNLCSGNCVVCSKAHGGNNLHFAKPEVLRCVIDQVSEFSNFPVFQFGGDGDAFLYPYFFSTLRMFRDRLPNCHRCLYTNGFMLSKQNVDIIVGEGLLHQIEIRIDSLIPDVYERSTGLPLQIVLDNIEYLAAQNESIAVCVLHLPLFKYRDTCLKVLNKEPTYFDRLIDLDLIDEWFDIQVWANKLGIRSRITGISLWAERTDCEFSDYKCPRLPDNWPGDMVRQIYVYPNGDLGFCGYDDAQCEFILGNILKDKMVDVWQGHKIQEFIERVRNRKLDDYPYCCVNPKACVMWEFDSEGESVDPAKLHG